VGQAWPSVAKAVAVRGKTLWLWYFSGAISAQGAENAKRNWIRGQVRLA
jgi:hypothetical protein